MSHFAGDSAGFENFVLQFFYSYLPCHFTFLINTSHKSMWSWRKCSSNSEMPLQLSVTFTFLAHMYYAAVLSHGSMCIFFVQRHNVPWLECHCGAADLILPSPESCTFTFNYASCWYSSAQREFFPCWWSCFSWAFPSSSRRNYTLKSKVVIQSVLISKTGFLICYKQISLIFKRRVCDWL